ncbi:unnamed protein product [Closterium sp. Yama58-4]|nr:unnamed protein product [Closterium sp. Yama58-4]
MRAIHPPPRRRRLSEEAACGAWIWGSRWRRRIARRALRRIPPTPTPKQATRSSRRRLFSNPAAAAAINAGTVPLVTMLCTAPFIHRPPPPPSVRFFPPLLATRHCPFGHYAVRTNAFMSRTNSLTEPMLLSPTKAPAPSSPALALLWDGSLPALLALQALTDQSKSATSAGSSSPNVVLTTLFDPHSGQVLSPTSIPHAAAATAVAATADAAATIAVSATTDGAATAVVAAKTDVPPATASRAAESLCCLPVSIRAVMDQSMALKRPLLAVPVEGSKALSAAASVPVKPVFEHQSLIRMAPLARGSTFLQPSQFRVLMHEAGTWQHVTTEEAVTRLASSPSPPSSRPSWAGAAPVARLPLVPTFVEIQAPAPASRFSRWIAAIRYVMHAVLR